MAGRLRGPDHSFREARLYLYVANTLGARVSTEVVISDDDRWLEYVRGKVKQDISDR